MNLNMPSLGMQGFFRLVTSEDPEMEKVVEDTGTFQNLITNTGLNRLGTAGPASSVSSAGNMFDYVCGRFAVGTGSATPSFTDTALQNPLVYASSSPSMADHSSNYERGWYEIRMSHQFTPGQATGNISEIGIQKDSLNGPLWSRALVLDGIGNPTTITVRDTDFLTCYYTLRIMIPKEDTVLNIVVDYGDDGQVPTEVTIRPYQADSTGGFNTSTPGWSFKHIANSQNYNRITWSSEGLQPPTATDLPNVSSINRFIGRIYYEPYIENSFENRAGVNLDITEMNGSTATIGLTHWILGCWQINFNPALVKEDTQTMDISFGYTWARA